MNNPQSHPIAFEVRDPIFIQQVNPIKYHDDRMHARFETERRRNDNESKNPAKRDFQK